MLGWICGLASGKGILGGKLQVSDDTCLGHIPAVVVRVVVVTTEDVLGSCPDVRQVSSAFVFDFIAGALIVVLFTKEAFEQGHGGSCVTGMNESLRENFFRFQRANSSKVRASVEGAYQNAAKIRSLG